MNETVQNFSLAGDTFMPKIRPKQARFTYSACGPFTKNKERMQKFIQKFVGEWRIYTLIR